MEYRIEKDSLGEVKVEADKLWGAQTQRSIENFNIGPRMPYAIIEALLLLKKCCAIANHKCGKLDKSKSDSIVYACDTLLLGGYHDQFPLVVFQTGSGTQTNMNVNEVIAHIAGEVHPNDDVNMSQSTNDIFPSAIHVAAVRGVVERLLPAISRLEKTLTKLDKENGDVVKIGRTHLQDATPLSFADEISGWRMSVSEGRAMIEAALPFAKKLAVGGTAVGTGINAPKDFALIVADELNKILPYGFDADCNKFHALSQKDAAVFLHGAIKALSCNLMKIANDIRLLSSGPRCGIGEITIPENEPGSSIMPGKVNPTQCEAMTMVASEIMGNDTTISLAASQGNFELNVFMPVIGFKLLESIDLLAQAIDSFDAHCVTGLKANKEKMTHYLKQSLMLSTAFSPYIGYEKCAKIVKLAAENNITLKEAALSLGYIDEEKFDEIINEAIESVRRK